VIGARSSKRAVEQITPSQGSLGFAPSPVMGYAADSPSALAATQRANTSAIELARPRPCASRPAWPHASHHTRRRGAHPTGNRSDLAAPVLSSGRRRARLIIAIGQLSLQWRFGSGRANGSASPGLLRPTSFERNAGRSSQFSNRSPRNSSHACLCRAAVLPHTEALEACLGPHLSPRPTLRGADLLRPPSRRAPASRTSPLLVSG